MCLNLQSMELADMLNTIAFRRSLTHLLKADNSSELAGKRLDKWVYWRSIRIGFSCLGTPMDNVATELFNIRLPQECLNETVMSLENAQ